MSDLELGVIGNCSFSALIDRRGRIVWCCLPRFDSDPIFRSLINGDAETVADGFFDVLIDDFAYSEQHYAANTAVLVTRLHYQHGAPVATAFAELPTEWNGTIAHSIGRARRRASAKR
jgi:GH15 family glucan-1,4-alpha-glucosidase